MFDGAKRAIIEKAAKWYWKDFLKESLAGKRGPQMKQMVTYLMTNRTKIGAVMTFLAGMILAAIQQQIVQETDLLKILAFVLSYCGVGLVGAGGAKSDDYYKDKQ